jgi:predicted dehydrogenase
VLGSAILHPVERTDLYATAILRFPGPILSQLACGVALAKDDLLAVYGSEGSIVIRQPSWLPDRRTAPAQILLARQGRAEELIDIAAQPHLLALEADGVARLLREGGPAASHPFWAETLANMRTLDRWRSAAGVIYRFEDESS